MYHLVATNWVTDNQTKTKNKSGTKLRWEDLILLEFVDLNKTLFLVIKALHNEIFN